MPSVNDFSFTTKVIRSGETYTMADEEIERLKNSLRAVSPQVELKFELTKYNERREKERQRTEQQNKYYHKLIDIICDHTGQEHEELHEELKFKFLAYPYVRGDREYTIVKSTTDLNSKNFSTFLEKVFMFASTELDLVLPEASDYYN